MFLFKKIISPFFYPLPLALAVILTGIVFLWLSRKQRVGKIMVTAGSLLILLFSSSFFSNILLKPLESRYPPITGANLENIKWILVLSGGYSSDPSISITSQLSDSALPRLIEGIRLHKSLPRTKLILTGGGFPVPESKIMAKLAEALGVSQDALVLESKSKDTKDQARYVKEIVGDDRFVLITSAYHMPRSMALFRKLGMSPIPAPTDHLVKKDYNKRLRVPLPSSFNLYKAKLAIHEYLGLVWAKFRGQT